MVLGVSYTVFDGIELLEQSIRQIREHVNFVHVAYQNVSWFGKSVNKEDLQKIDELKRKGLIDQANVYTSFSVLSNSSPQNIRIAKSYETNKRQFGLNICLSKGCTHFLSIDVDEFYIPSQFKAAKDYIINTGVTSTACKFINYVNLPIYHRGYSPAYVPFICKIDKSSKMTSSFFAKCDPTRGITDSAKKIYAFSTDSLTMHHMETIRKDLFKKYESTTRAIFNRAKTSELINNIKSIKSSESLLDFNKIIFPALGSQKIYEVENIFNIPYQTW